MKPKKRKNIPSENISPEGSLRLDDVTRLTLLRLEAEGRAAHNEMLLRQKELADYIRSVDPSGNIARQQGHIAALLSKKGEMQSQFNELIRRTGERLKIDMASVSYDEETGIIHFPPADPEIAKK